ncbi:MAG: IPT/TIG domain-containing protein [Chloroflexi bacterium]|nr:IPT/TIG domain-containing protein [Chloroflexota bacterium]
MTATASRMIQRAAWLWAVVALAAALTMAASVQRADALVGPSVTSLSPNSGPVIGGTVVTIEGSGFTGVTGVTFGGVPGTGVTFVNDTHVMVMSPAHAAGAVPIVVTTNVGSSGATEGSQFTYQGGPVVTSLIPVSGPTSGGTFVNVYGSGFTGATSVTFGGVPGSGLTVLDDTHLSVVAPPHAAGPVYVTVYVNLVSSGAVPASVYTYTGGPVVTSISPNFGPSSGGTVVTVNGAGFTGTTAVTFGGVSSASVTVLNDFQLLAVAPPHFPATVDIQVTTVSGTSAPTVADLFNYSGIGPIAVYSVIPASGPVTGGTLVTVTGTGFTNASSVTFGGVAGALVQIFNDTQLQVYSPAHAAGSYYVQVTSPFGTSPATAAGTFTFTGGLAIYSISPASGPTTGGTLVTITGTGFLGVTSVSFGGVAANSFTILNDGQIQAYSPPHSAGAVTVVVTAPGVSSAASPADSFTYTAAGPVIGAISPASGPAAGGTVVTITGSGFTGATAVSFGGVAAASFTVVNDTQITATSPSRAAGNATITVTTPSGSASSAAAFSFTSPAPSEPPGRFVGSVTIDGVAAPSGTQVQARIGSVVCGASTTFTQSGVARYVLDSPAASETPGCGADGAAVTLYVNGTAGGTGVWRNYQLNEVNLAIGVAQPAPTPTPTRPPGPTPAPPNTGSGGYDANALAGLGLVLSVLGGLAVLALGVPAARRQAMVAGPGSRSMVGRAAGAGLEAVRRIVRMAIRRG